MAKIVSINNNLNSIVRNKTFLRKQNIMDNDDSILGIIGKLRREAERRVSEYGDFGIVRTHFKNKDKSLNVKSVELLIKPSILLKERPKERELEIVVKSVNEKNKYSLVLKRGDKKEVLNYLEDEELPLRVNEAIDDASVNFSEISEY